MNFINDNMNIIILVCVGLFVFYYILSYYVHSIIDNEMLTLKKKFKRLQMSIMQPNVQPPILQTPTKKIEFSKDDDNEVYEKQEIDIDSYFDPTKVSTVS